MGSKTLCSFTSVYDNLLDKAYRRCRFAELWEAIAQHPYPYDLNTSVHHFAGWEIMTSRRDMTVIYGDMRQWHMTVTCDGDMWRWHFTVTYDGDMWRWRVNVMCECDGDMTRNKFPNHYLSFWTMRELIVGTFSKLRESHRWTPIWSCDHNLTYPTAKIYVRRADFTYAHTAHQKWNKINCHYLIFSFISKVMCFAYFRDLSGV